MDEPATTQSDSYCDDCRKLVSEHAICPECKHADCDCICEFLRTEWPTHHANPNRIEAVT